MIIFTFFKKTIDGEHCDIYDDGYFLDENGIVFLLYIV